MAVYFRSMPLTASKVADAITPASRFATAAGTFAVAKLFSIVWFQSITTLEWVLPAAKAGGAIDEANATIAANTAKPSLIFMALTCSVGFERSLFAARPRA